MANAIYPKYKEFLLSSIANVKAVLVDTADYTYSSAHQFLSSVPAAARVATSATLTGITFIDGVLDANDVTLTAVTGDPFEAILLYIDTGTESTSRLVAYMDSGWTTLPTTPNGGNITLQFNASGIFAL